MNNYEAISYAVVANSRLKKNNIEVTKENLVAEMLSLMDQYSEKEISKLSMEVE